MIHGNLEGIRESVLNDLEKLYDAEFERDMFLPDRLLNVLVKYTEQINREMLLYLGRDGSVLEIAIGSIGSRCRSCISGAIRTGFRASGASTRIRAGTRGFPAWIYRRCGCFASIRCAPWACRTAAAAASARPFWAKRNMIIFP